MSCRLFWLFAFLLVVFQSQPAFAARSCAQPRALPVGGAVIELAKPIASTDVSAGQIARIEWRLSSAAKANIPRTCGGRLVVVFGFDGAVRFNAGAFVGLLPLSPGLYGISAFSSKSRVFFEISGSESEPFGLPVTFWSLGQNRVDAEAFYIWTPDDGATASFVALGPAQLET